MMKQMQRNRHSKAFTIVEMLVVISIIGLLIGVLIPAITYARNTARTTQSLANLRQLGAAHATYASDFEDRQFTVVPDDLATYGDTPELAVQGYFDRKGRYPPPFIFGKCRNPQTGDYVTWPARFSSVQNQPSLAPISFDTGFGWFRLPNLNQFSQYLNGRFYDPVFYAPKDTIVLDYIQPGLDSPDEYVPSGSGAGFLLDNIGFSSYCLSPAALFNPSVMRSPEEGGWQDPWTVGAGLRTPSMSQAQYSNLKTHMLEHHWLQNTQKPCNPAFPNTGTYDGCEPYYFNAATASAPQGLFFDGHVGSAGVSQAITADARARNQSGSSINGLWSRDTPFGTDGYFNSNDFIYNLNDPVENSFHILTTDGIRGRDVLNVE